VVSGPDASPAATPLTLVTETSAPLLRRLELVVRHRLDGLLQGNYLGLLPGPGSEAGESRLYHPGDDVRRMDWAVTARTTTAHVRQTVADRELETWLVVDLSPSLDFGTALSEKRELVFAAITAIVHLTVRGGNRVGAIVTSGEQTYRIPARAGRTDARHLIERIAATPRAWNRSGALPAGAGSSPSSLTSSVTPTGNGRCGRSASATNCWASRSSTHANSNCRTPAWSRSSIRKAASSSRCRRPARTCGPATPTRPGHNGPRSARSCATPARGICNCVPTGTGSRTWCAT
jgi:hypothetical protein